MQRKFNFGVDEYYHVYNRGNDKRLIFNDDFDRNRFLRSLFLLNTSDSVEMRHYGRLPSVKIFEPSQKGGMGTIVDIGAYCLMPNHFHLLIREKVDGGISLFMKKLLISYSKYFNLKHKRIGSLFEGPFRATHIDNDRYLHYLFAYIHLNPTKIAFPTWPEAPINDIIKAEQYLANYQFSSYLDYAREDRRPEEQILTKKAFPEYFQKPSDFNTFLADWVKYQEIE